MNKSIVLDLILVYKEGCVKLDEQRSNPPSNTPNSLREKSAKLISAKRAPYFRKNPC